MTSAIQFSGAFQTLFLYFKPKRRNSMVRKKGEKNTSQLYLQFSHFFQVDTWNTFFSLGLRWTKHQSSRKTDLTIVSLRPIVLIVMIHASIHESWNLVLCLLGINTREPAAIVLTGSAQYMIQAGLTKRGNSLLL